MAPEQKDKDGVVELLITRESKVKGQVGDEEAPALVGTVLRSLWQLEDSFSSDTSKVAFGKKNQEKQKAKTEIQENGRVAKPFPWSI